MIDWKAQMQLDVVTKNKHTQQIGEQMVKDH